MVEPLNKIPLATAVASSIKHQKKPLKEGEGGAKRRATQTSKESSAGKRGSKLTFIYF